MIARLDHEAIQPARKGIVNSKPMPMVVAISLINWSQRELSQDRAEGR
jgi:hypothetical protein